MEAQRHIAARTLAMAALLLAMAWPLYGQDTAPPTMVIIDYQSTKTVVASGVTNLVILDPEIAAVEVGADIVRFIGLQPGETVAVGFIKDQAISIRVRVLNKPVIVIPPSLLLRQQEMGQGTVSSNVQTSTSNGVTAIGLVDSLSWSQLAGRNGHLDIMGQMEQDTYGGGHAFNLRTASIAYYDPHLDVRAGDFNANLIGSGPQGFVNTFSFSDLTVLRGASVGIKRGNNEYDFFAGTTVPYYYLTLGSTRDAAGLTFRRKQSDTFGWFITSSFLNAPVNFLGLTGGRRDNFMQTAGFAYTPSRRLSLRVAGGESNHGGMVRAEVTYQTTKMNAFASGILSSVLFPANQLGSFFTGTDYLKAGWTYRNTGWLTESLSYQHVVTQALSGVTTAGSSDYLSPSVWIKLGQKQDLNVEYDYSHNAGGFSAEPSTGNRVDAYWTYRLRPKLSNTAQITVGSVQDPLQINSEDQFMVRDSVYFPVKGGSLSLAVEHDQTNTSLVAKLQSELSLLSPALQALFLADPVAFVNSPNLPPEIRALLDAQQPIGTSVSAAGQFHVGHRFDVGPSVSVVHSTNGSAESWTPFVGYGMRYQLTRTLQLTSSLSNIWVLANSQGAAQHTMVFSFGITKSFNAAPSMFRSPFHHGCIIEGRVFRDTNVNGVFNAGERGFDNVRVELDTGDSVVTDELGRYKFDGVSPGQHHVILNLGQFSNPVRMTTPSVAEADLIRNRVAVVNFGVVDFARLMGSVFNDLRFEGRRQADSKGMPMVRLVLDDGKQKRTIESQDGDFEVVDLPPGNYTLSVDPSTVPANYVLPKDSFPVHVSPISTTVQDVPLRALRSIAGRVFLKVPKTSQGGGQVGSGGQQGMGGPAKGTDYTLVPMAEIRLQAGPSTAISDRNGNFLLRDLPAGDLAVMVVPVKPLPPGVQAPGGSVHMPAEPIQVQGATIVISSPDLVPYLVGKTAQEVRNAAIAEISSR
jgi:hypothetical protein